MNLVASLPAAPARRVGRPLPGLAVKIIAIVDGPIATLADARELPPGEIGEIIVRGAVVTREYDDLPEATARAKIPESIAPDSPFWHRMGDCGYLDPAGCLWFSGRVAERVETASGPMYTEPCEQVFLRHPQAQRCALIGLGERGRQIPALVAETPAKCRAAAGLRPGTGPAGPGPSLHGRGHSLLFSTPFSRGRETQRKNSPPRPCPMGPDRDGLRVRSENSMNVLVTGGTGFLGRHLVERLLGQGRRVTVLGRTPAPDLEARGVRLVRGSLDNAAAVADACAGVETVFHVAARVGVWGRYEDFFRSNVRGTRAVIAGCRHHGVSRLIYTSTPSVVYNGRNLAGADESLPLTTRCPSPYPLSKAVAEREVLAADSPALRTVALRPHLIWGVDDPHLIPRLLARARAGRLRIVGQGKNRVDMVHVENAVDAHLLRGGGAGEVGGGRPEAGRPRLFHHQRGARRAVGVDQRAPDRPRRAAGQTAHFPARRARARRACEARLAACCACAASLPSPALSPPSWQRTTGSTSAPPAATSATPRESAWPKAPPP